MRQQQKTIKAHRASPQASGMPLMRRDSKPNAISTITALAYRRRFFVWAFIYMVFIGMVKIHNSVGGHELFTSRIGKDTGRGPCSGDVSLHLPGFPPGRR